MTLVRQIVAGTAAIAAGAVVAACGVKTQDAGQSASVSTTPTLPTTTERRVSERERRRQALPGFPAGVVRLGGTQDDLARRLITTFEASGDVNIAATRSSDAQAYADLCAGRVDVIETSALPTDAIRAACDRNGLELVDSLQLASDAIVLATKNQADVGGDCLTVAQARDIFRSGSPYSNWNQLGFFDLPLITTGRQQSSENFTFFGQVVLGLTDPRIDDVRSDYRVRTSDRRQRQEVVGTARLKEARARVVRYRERLVENTRAERRRFVERAATAAANRVLADIRRINAERAARRIAVRDPRALAARNAARVERAKRAARVRANRAFDRQLDRQVLRYQRRVLGAANAPGVIGPFRFSYYELYEEQLRPMEMDYGVPETRDGQPVRLSDLRPEDRRRVQALLTGSTGATSTTATTATTPGGTTTTSTTTTTADPTLADVPTAELPETTESGERIYPGPNCVFPSQLTITTGAYPLTRRIFLITTKRSLARDEVKRFLTSVFDNVQTVAPLLRLVPITDQQRRDAYIDITGAPPADLVQQQREEEAARRALTTTTTTTTPTTRTTTTAPRTTTTTTTTPPASTTTTPGAAPNGIPGVSSRG